MKEKRNGLQILVQTICFLLLTVLAFGLFRQEISQSAYGILFGLLLGLAGIFVSILPVKKREDPDWIGKSV